MKKLLIISYVINVVVVGAFFNAVNTLPEPVNEYKTVVYRANDGKSAYQIWLDNGHTGSEQEYLQAIQGEDGTDSVSINRETTVVKQLPPEKGDKGDSIKGDTGLSAYDLAVQQGYEGSIDEWLSSLRGADGLTPELGCANDGRWMQRIPGNSLWQIINGTSGCNG